MGPGCARSLGGMPSAEAITDAVTRYLKAVADGTAEDVASCYAEEATLEDPVGSEPHRGRAAIKRFYTAIEDVQLHTELRMLRIAGGSAAFGFLVRTELPDRTFEIEPIDVMTFDENAQITSMRAYWSQEDTRLVE